MLSSALIALGEELQRKNSTLVTDDDHIDTEGENNDPCSFSDDDELAENLIQ